MINDSSITFSRYGESILGADGKMTAAAAPTSIPTRGSLQPMGKGAVRQLDIVGSKSVKAYWYMTRTELFYGDEDDETEADTCVIGGKTFIVFDVADNSSAFMPTMSYFECVLIEVKEETT